jgi:hypothetical protein
VAGRDALGVRLEFPSPYWDEISPEAKDLIRHMLEVMWT